MSKRPSDKESHYKNIINKQKSIIKNLKKKAGRGNKSKERFDDLELELMAQIDEETSRDYKEEGSRCPECHKGILEFIDLKVRKMFICSNCSYRQVKK